MKRTLIALAAFAGCILPLSCSKAPGIPRFNMDYSTEDAGRPQYIYQFTPTAVNVWVQGIPVGDGTSVINATNPYDHIIRIPILENAPYKINGFTLTIDWSKHKPNYFPLTGSNNLNETFNIENTGYILRSATDTNLYLSMQS